MIVTDYRWRELAEAAKVRPPHLFFLYHWLAAGNPVEAFAAFANMEEVHVERMVATLLAAGVHPTFAASQKRRTSERVNGTRLPLVMQLPDDWKAFAQETRRWDVATVEIEFQMFLDYWHAQPGTKGVKLDWLATWRNWTRRSHTPDGYAAPERKGWQPTTREELERAIGSGERYGYDVSEHRAALEALGRVV